MKPFSIVVAVDLKCGIGKEGKLPWSLPSDMAHFKELTTKTRSHNKQNAVIMGRKTWESIPFKFRPLSGRVNIILTRKKEFVVPENVFKASSFNNALQLLEQKDFKKSVAETFVIGGAEVFSEAIRHPFCQRIHLTQIFHEFSCDAFFPAFQNIFAQKETSPQFSENSLRYSFLTYERKK